MSKISTPEEWIRAGRPSPEKFLKPGDFIPADILSELPGFKNRYDEDGTTFIQDIHPTDIFGHEGLFHTFSRKSVRHPIQYQGICRKNSADNAHPETAVPTFIISPYYAEDDDGALFNLQMAIAACRREYGLGRLPIAPHIYFPQFLKENEFERDYGIAAGHMLMNLCQAVTVYIVDGVISSGMESDIEYAVNRLSIDPDFYSLDREQAKNFIEAECSVMA